jgi:hypothetical protein
MKRYVLVIAAGAAVLALASRELPAMRRYIKIERM